MDPEPEPEWLTVIEVADLVGVARSTVYRWIESGRLPAIGTGVVGRGGGTRIRFDQLLSFIETPPSQSFPDGTGPTPDP